MGKNIRKTRSDKKHTIQTRLTPDEMRVFNRFRLANNFETVLDAANYCVKRGLHEGTNTYIVDFEIEYIKSRKVSDSNTILVNSRVDSKLFDVFKDVRIEFNLNQRQLLYILIWRILDVHNFNLTGEVNGFL